MVGRLSPEKNQALLVDALARLGRDRVARWRVWLVGAVTGPRELAEDLRRRVGELGLGDVVRFVEPTPRIAAVMERLDAVVLTSLYEGFPNVLLEAMATGRACISTPVGEAVQLIDHGQSGLLVEPGDAEGLAQALLRLEGDPDERRRLGARARAVVAERYRIETVARGYLDLYRAALART